jgi:hypothetical protein
VKQHIALIAGVLVSAIAGPALAQPLPPAYPGAVYPGANGPGVPPYEVVAIVRSTGLEPLTRPVRNGTAYALRALDPAGQEVRVVVDARNGRIARVVPVPGPRHVDPRYGEFPPPYGRAAGRLVPDGYGPGERTAALPPGAEGTPPSAHAPAIGSAPRPAAQSAPPPLPRPRPKSAAADSSAAKPDAAKPEMAAPQAAPAHEAAKDEKPAATSTIVPAPAAPSPADELNE